MPRYVPYDFECGTCGRAFPAVWEARDRHCRSTGHSPPQFECDSCPRWFDSRRACTQHMNDTNHWPFPCAICDETWPTSEQCTEHEQMDHYYCGQCDRYFNNYNIKMHLNSRVHRGRQMKCPFCSRLFATATGITHHLETGAFPNAQNPDRDQLYRFVRRKDPDGVISKNLLGWTGSCKYEANARSWNGHHYECYLCHHTFGSLNSLNQHLNSAVHQQPLYHCPNPACRMDFKTLAGIINHLESEACGCTRFEQVQQRIGDFVLGNRLIPL